VVDLDEETVAVLQAHAGRQAEEFVSERLGHATPVITMTVYAHVLPGMPADAAATFRRTPSNCAAGI